jgi:hypothetical protein
MSHKHFTLLISIFFSISMLTASSMPTGIIPLTALTDPQVAATKIHSKPIKPELVTSGSIPVNPPPAASLSAGTDTYFGSLPLYFVENRGQADPHVAYYVLGSSTQVYFTRAGVTFAFMKTENTSPLRVHTDAPTKRWVVKLDFVNANPVKPTGAGPTQAIVSYFKGPSDQWHAGLSTYAQVVYPNLWSGIDLVFYGQVGQLSYDFLVHPGADPAQIRLRYRGVESISLDAVGQMQVDTRMGGFMERAPVAWQAEHAEHTSVSAKFELIGSSLPKVEQISPALLEQGRADAGVTYDFTIGSYDQTQPLLIDPVVLVNCGYIGGSGDDYGRAIALDSGGNIYVTGETLSTQDSFPVTTGPDLIANGLYDAFVTKVNASGTALVYSGFIGGALNDFSWGIAVDGEGSAYVAGETWSPQDSFPVKIGPALTYKGATDGYVAKISASGDALVYAGYIGGVVYDAIYGIAVDDSGNAYVTGATGSDQLSFPIQGSLDPTFNGVEDAFVAKVNPTGEALIYAGYIGGSDWDWGMAIAVDAAGNAYVTGRTKSTAATFPVKIGPDLTHNGGDDAFIARVNPSGSGLDYAGYIGGVGEDYARAIAVDDTGNAYITGETASTQNSFPVTLGPDLTYNGGEKDAFVAKVSTTGATLVYAGYIGGIGGDFGYGIAVDAANSAYIVGFTYSNQDTFPVTSGPLSTYNGGDRDAFVAKVNASGSGLDYAGFIGGLGIDYGAAIAVDGDGNAYITGITNSNQASFPVKGGPDLTYNGGLWDAFVAKVSIVPWTLYLPLAINGN